MVNSFKKTLFIFLITGFSLSAEITTADITPEMEYEILTQMEITENISISDIADSIAIHTLASISANHRTIRLTDGSVWKIGHLWRHRLSTWCQNDELRFSIHLFNAFNLIKIENLHQHSVVWGNFKERPDIETADARWIVDTYLDSLIELNDGSVFRTSGNFSPNRSKWGSGDAMFILSNDTPEIPYVLWDLTWGTIIPCTLYLPPVISN